MGTTSRGTPVIINRIAAEADRLVLTGCCTYHPWVGWGGGKKSILPGISSIESIQKNHLMTMDEHGRQRPEVASGNIKDNPIHLDMLEVASIVKPAFMFNVIMGHDGKIARAVCGDTIAAHDVGRGIVDELYEVPIKELADITISSQGGYPERYRRLPDRQRHLPHAGSDKTRRLDDHPERLHRGDRPAGRKYDFFGVRDERGA